MKIALFSSIIGKDQLSLDTISHWISATKKWIGQDKTVEFFMLTEKNEPINEDIVQIRSSTMSYPYSSIIKNNLIREYLDLTDKWKEYSYIYFIEIGLIIQDEFDFFSYPFIRIDSPAISRIKSDYFYGGNSSEFENLCNLFYEEKKFIIENQLTPPKGLDVHYLELFQKECGQKIQITEKSMDSSGPTQNINKNCEEDTQGSLQIYVPSDEFLKIKNNIQLLDAAFTAKEYIVNLEDKYIFNFASSDVGHLLKFDTHLYQIFWSRHPESREVLNMDKQQIFPIENLEFTPFEKQESISTEYILNSKPAISIVLPFYNPKIDYLKGAIESILNQTFSDYELLLIDDGSSDLDAKELIESYDDPRIRLLTNAHDFIDSLNRGIKEAQGKYIARMDADDLMIPSRLEIQYDYMEKHPEIGVCGSWVELIGDGYGYLRKYEHHPNLAAQMLLNNPLVHPTVLMRTSICQSYSELYKKGYPYAEDYKLWVDLINDGVKFSNIPQALVKYRFSTIQVSYTKSDIMADSALKIRTEYAEQTMENLVEFDEDYYTLFEKLIHLTNSKKINSSNFSKILYQIYLNKLQKEFENEHSK